MTKSPAKRKPPPPEAEGVLALFRAADRLRRYLTARLAEHRLSLQQYNVLRILRGAGGTLPTMEIRDRMMEHAPGITRIIDGLVKRGHVEREHPDSDRRQVLCHLTASGRRLLGTLDPAMDAADRRAFSGLGRKRLRTLIAELGVIQNNLSESR